MTDSLAGIVAEMRDWDYEQGNPDSFVVSDWADRIAALEAGAKGVVDEAMVRDAERYRWLREFDRRGITITVGHMIVSCAATLDAAIDAALTGEKA